MIDDLKEPPASREEDKPSRRNPILEAFSDGRHAPGGYQCLLWLERGLYVFRRKPKWRGRKRRWIARSRDAYRGRSPKRGIKYCVPGIRRNSLGRKRRWTDRSRDAKRGRSSKRGIKYCVPGIGVPVSRNRCPRGSVAGSPARATHTGAAARSEELSIVSREFIGRDIRPIANGNVAPRFAHHLDFAQWKTDIDD